MLSGPAWSKESAHKKSPEAQYLWASEPSIGSVRERIRTPDTLVRSQVLYPAELHAHLCNELMLHIFKGIVKPNLVLR